MVAAASGGEALTSCRCFTAEPVRARGFCCDETGSLCQRGTVVDEQQCSQVWALLAERIGDPGPGWAEVLCHACLQWVTGIDGAALTVGTTPHQRETHAASSEWAASVSETQYTLADGPGAEVFTTLRPVLVDTLTTGRARWPIFCEAAGRIGLAAMFVFPLCAGNIPLGTLELYGRYPGELDGERVHQARTLARLATRALLAHFEHTGPEGLAPARSHALVHAATGMLAESLGITLDEALARLRACAFRTDRPAIELATELTQRRLDPNDFAT